MNWSDYFNKLGEDIMGPLTSLWKEFVNFAPGLIVAIVIAVIGYIVAAFLGWVVKKIISKTNLDSQLAKSGRLEAIGNIEVSYLIGQIIKWYVFVLFLIRAVKALKLGELSTLLLKFVNWLPSVIIAAVIFLFGLLVADYCAKKVAEIESGRSRPVGLIVRILFVFFFIDISLKRIGINIIIAENTFLIIIGGAALAFAIAVGMGFGLALKEEAKPIIRKLKK